MSRSFRLFKRTLSISYIPNPITGYAAAFLWGPRQTSKTTLLKQRYADVRYYDLLNTDLFQTVDDFYEAEFHEIVYVGTVRCRLVVDGLYEDPLSWIEVLYQESFEESQLLLHARMAGIEAKAERPAFILYDQGDVSTIVHNEVLSKHDVRSYLRPSILMPRSEAGSQVLSQKILPLPRL